MTNEEEKGKTRGFVITVPEICILEKKKKSIWKKIRIHFVLFDLYLFFQRGILNSARRHEPEPGPKANTAEHPFAMSGDRGTGGEADARRQRAASLPRARPRGPTATPRGAPRRGRALRAHVRGHSARGSRPLAPRRSPAHAPAHVCARRRRPPGPAASAVGRWEAKGRRGEREKGRRGKVPPAQSPVPPPAPPLTSALCR